MAVYDKPFQENIFEYFPSLYISAGYTNIIIKIISNVLFDGISNTLVIFFLCIDITNNSRTKNGYETEIGMISVIMLISLSSIILCKSFILTKGRHYKVLLITGLIALVFIIIESVADLAFDRFSSLMI